MAQDLPPLVPFKRADLSLSNGKPVLFAIQEGFAKAGLKVEEIQRVQFMWWYVLVEDGALYLMDLSHGGGCDGFYLDAK